MKGSISEFELGVLRARMLDGAPRRVAPDRRRRASPQLPYSLGRPCHAHPQYNAFRRRSADDRTLATDPTAATRLRPPRHRPHAVDRGTPTCCRSLGKSEGCASTAAEVRIKQVRGME